MIKISENIALFDKTSYRIGGGARFYAEPCCEEEIIEAYKFAGENGLDVFVLGRGTNLLISDNGINGLVLNLSAKYTFVEWDNVFASVSGGYLLDGLALLAARKGLAGIEELSGIPGTIGGAVVMNAGAFETEIAGLLRSARVLRVPALTVETVLTADLALGYRTSALKGGRDVVLSAVFKFTQSDAETVLTAREKILSRRREKQPLDLPSCGSVFKRPQGNYAGTLIESCGLKGFSIGGATVSEKHANFIVNTGKATAKDVMEVIKHIQNVVYKKTSILLEPEVIFMGF